uniref:EF-hand domain-containing protein n=1 Tax=Setaria digitata TaxID=48799 RepID=A0A915PIH1_9BILA
MLYHRHILITATLQFIIGTNRILTVGDNSQIRKSAHNLPAAPPAPLKFGDKKAVHDTAHIKQHLVEKLDVMNISLDNKMEIFHYFRMHDLNRDGKIDGVELVKGLTHLHDEASDQKEGVMSDEDLEYIVSGTLRSMDKDDDGYITFPEFNIAHSF